MRLNYKYAGYAALGVTLLAFILSLAHRAHRENQRFATVTAQALLRIHQENRPAAFSSNVVVPVSPLLAGAGGPPLHPLPVELQRRNPLTCVVTPKTVDLRCVLTNYMFQTNVSDRWVLERDAHDPKKWSLFEVHGFWGFHRGPLTTITE